MEEIRVGLCRKPVSFSQQSAGVGLGPPARRAYGSERYSRSTYNHSYMLFPCSPWKIILSCCTLLIALPIILIYERPLLTPIPVYSVELTGERISLYPRSLSMTSFCSFELAVASLPRAIDFSKTATFSLTKDLTVLAAF
jgi:hypothetical protein